MQVIDDATGQPRELQATIPSEHGVCYSAFLAYPRSVLSSKTASEGDEGEARLDLLRRVLLSFEGSNTNRDNLRAVFDWVASHPEHYEDVRKAFMEQHAPRKPSIRRVQQQHQHGGAHFVSLDAVAVEYQAGIGTPRGPAYVAVQSGGERESAFVDLRPATTPVSMIKAEYHPKDESHIGIPHVYISVTRVSATSVGLVARSSLRKGGRITHTFAASREAVGALFCELVRPEAFATPAMAGNVPRALPIRQAAQPEWLQVELAAFWQRIMRCHVIPAVCRGESGTVRPLVFEEFTAQIEQDRLCVRGTLHVSRAVCMCGLWGAKPRNPSRDAEVRFELSMCGKALDGQSMCTRCTDSTPHTDLKVCVAHTTASIICKHHDHDDRKSKRIGKSGKGNRVRAGLELRNITLGQEARTTAQLLMEAVAGARLWCYDTNNEVAVCKRSAKQSERLKRRLETAASQFDLGRAPPSEMARRDDIVLKHLRKRAAGEEGALDIYRTVKRGTGEPSLVLLSGNMSSAGRDNDEKNKKKPALPIKYARLAPTHAHLFPPLCEGR